MICGHKPIVWWDRLDSLGWAEWLAVIGWNGLVYLSGGLTAVVVLAIVIWRMYRGVI